MAILSTAITFLIGMALLLACQWMRYGRSITRPSSMADEAFGLSALSLPAGWRAAKNLNEQAGIQALDPLRGRYVIVISEFRSDSPTLTLEEHARRTMSMLVLLLAADTLVLDGTTLWELAPSATGVPQRSEVLQAVPQESTDATGEPALFLIDEGTTWVDGVLRRVDNRPTIIRAVTADGRELWQQTLTGPTIKHVAADQQGGLVVVLNNSYGLTDNLPEGIERLDGLTGRMSWEYFSNDGSLSEAAIRADGTVFVVDEAYHTAETWLVALDALTGTPTRWALPPGHVSRLMNGAPDLATPDWAKATGPIVQEDGSIVVVSRRTISNSAWLSFEVAPGQFQTWPDPNYLATSLSDVQRTTLASDGITPITETIVGASESEASFDPSQFRLLPDGKGGLLVANRRAAYARRISPAGGLGAGVWLIAPNTYASPYETEYVLGDSAAYALIKGYGSGAERADLVEFSPTTLVAQTPSEQFGAPNVQLRAATIDGAYLSGPLVNDGQQPVGPGFWVANRPNPVLTFDSAAAIANSASPEPKGDMRSANCMTRWFRTMDQAAFEALKYMREWTELSAWEWGGFICQQGEHYLTSRVVTSRSASSVDIFAQTTCSPYGTAVGQYHTHRLLGNPDPSGFVPGTTVPNDISIADNHPELVFYLGAPKPDGYFPPRTTHVLSFQRPNQGSSSRDSVLEWSSGGWVAYPPPQ